MKIRKNNLGMVHPMMIGLAVVVIAVVGVAAWKVMSNNKTTNSSTASTSAKAPNNAAVATACNKAISDTNICNFASHYNANASYKATDTATTSDGTQSLTISSDGKGNSEISTVAGGQTTDFITLNGATYVKDPTSNTWIKYTVAASTAPSNPASDLKISTSDITGNGTITYKNLGTATCGSDTCYKYQIVDTSQADTTQYVWFGTLDYQLHEFYSKNADGTNDMTFSYQAVNITAPSPVTSY